MRRLLIHAAEEASEFVQAAMKLARGDWGVKKLTDEAADMAAFVLVLLERGFIDRERFATRLEFKLNKMRKKYASKANRK